MICVIATIQYSIFNHTATKIYGWHCWSMGWSAKPIGWIAMKGGTHIHVHHDPLTFHHSFICPVCWFMINISDIPISLRCTLSLWPPQRCKPGYRLLDLFIHKRTFLYYAIKMGNFLFMVCFVTSCLLLENKTQI